MEPSGQIGDGHIDAADFLRKNTEFTWVREHGKTVAGRFIVLGRTPAPDGKTRLGIVVSKRCCRKAVGRNRGRRLIRESYRLSRHGLESGWWLVAIARYPIVQACQQEVQNELLRLIARLDKADSR